MIIKSRFVEDSTATIRARITALPTDVDGVPLVQADFDTIELFAYSNGELVNGFNGVNLDPAEVIYDELQPWEIDDVGFNFKYSISPNAFPTGNVVGQVLVKFTTTAGEVDHVEFKGRIQNVLSS